MNRFDTHKFLHRKRLAEEELLQETLEPLISKIDTAIAEFDESFSYQDLAVVVAALLKKDEAGYGSHNFEPFLKTLINLLKS